MIIAIILAYFAVLMVVSRLTARRGGNATFFTGERQSPWYLVAFGMIGASISGVSFVSVPGMVMSSDMTYLQMCMGFIVGYFVVAFVLLPIYYRQRLVTIYSVLKGGGQEMYKTGSAFFIISKLLGSAAKFYVPCFIISRALGWPFALTIVVLLLLVWLYTRRGGIRTLVWTDTLQTLCMLTALCLIIYKVSDALAMPLPDAFSAVLSSDHARIFEFSDWSSSQHFVKQFISGIFVVIVMTGLDQDMMQKNLTCRNLRAAQKDMCSYGLAFVPVNLLFLMLGVMLVMLCGNQGVALPERGDTLLTMFAATGQLGTLVLLFFSLGIIASSFSTIDSSLTAITTCVCVDICQRPDDERLRGRVHAAMAMVLVLCVLAFDVLKIDSLIAAVYTLVSYTYGPLLGLFSYCLLHRKQPMHFRRYGVVLSCLAAPLLCLALDNIVPVYTGYHFGYELLLINGALTYVGLSINRIHNSNSHNIIHNT